MSNPYQHITLILIALFFLQSAACRTDNRQVKQEDAAGHSRTVIAFGSCSRQYNPNQRWEDIMKHDPDIWIWLGDNIYGDSHDMSVLSEKYAHQKNDSAYQLLLESDTDIIGTWDDHDYGINDGGRYFSKKAQSKMLFMDFMDLPHDHDIMDHEGVFQAYDYDFDGHHLEVILLDTRYFRDTVYRDLSTRAYLPNPDGDMLGDQQWAWLENRMRTSRADLILVGSSIQVIPEEHRFEKWANLPSAKEKLLNLLQQYPDKRVVFLSGDRHIAEISELNLEELYYPLYDFTSSGLTHTWQNADPEPNQYRVSDFIVALNFGLIIIDWDGKDGPDVTFQIRGEQDTLLYQMKAMLF